MASYKLLIKRSAAKELEGLPSKVRRQVVDRVAELGATPRPQGVEKLSGQEKYRIRQGAYRVLYSIDVRGPIASSTPSMTLPRR